MKQTQTFLGGGLLVICLLAFLSFFNRWENKVVGNWSVSDAKNGLYDVRVRFHENGTVQFRSSADNFNGYWKVTNRFKKHVRLSEHPSGFDPDHFAVSFKGNKMFLHHLTAKGIVWECVRIPDHEL